MSDIRLYHSALQNVTYVYGKPVPFTTDKALLAKYEADKAAMEARAR